MKRNTDGAARQPPGAGPRTVAERACAAIGEKFRVEIDGFRDTPVGPHPVANVPVVVKPEQPHTLPLGRGASGVLV